MENEWFSSNKGRKLGLFQYLVFQTPQASASGPVTIYAHQMAHRGHVAYAQTLSAIIRDKFPEQKLRIIIYHQPDAYERIQSFRFHPDIDVMLISYEADELQKHI